MASRSYYECPKGLKAKVGAECGGGKKTRECLGVLNFQLFNENCCYKCEHYLHLGLEERLRKEILEEKKRFVVPRK